MGVSDRDYMRRSSDDRKRVEAYEDSVRDQEYGELSSWRGSKIKKIAVWIVAALVLLGLAAMLVGIW